MEFCNLDMIVRRCLLEKSMPIHWYAEYLFHCAAAIRELSKDTLKIINAANLPVNDYNAANLPGDFMDDIAVCLPTAGLLQPLVKQDNINPLRQHDATTGLFTPYTNTTQTDNTFFGFPGSWNWYWNVNDYGEPTGRYFGAQGGTASGYQLFKERRQIQFTGTVDGGSAILLYVSNGQHIDNATQIDWMAFSAIQAYNNWKRSPNADITLSPEGLSYVNEKRVLRANMDDLTKTVIINIVRNAFMATIKN
jgi:hypothetical protein